MRRSILFFLAAMMILATMAGTFTVGAENAIDFGFAGVQLGDGALRLVGYTDSADYDAVGFDLSISGDATKEASLTTTRVFAVLNGEDGVVAATKTAGVDAPVVVDHAYLYGYSIENIADGFYTFELVATAIKGEEKVAADVVTFPVTVKDGAVSIKKTVYEPIAVDPATGAYDLVGTEFGESVAGIFDGNLGTKLCAGVDSWPLTITWELAKAETVAKYEIVSGNDHPGRDPKDWVLYGSNDKENWSVIDQRSDNAFAGNNTNDNRVTPFGFEVDNATAYQYYKWVVSANNGLPHFQLMELRLFSEAEAGAVEQSVSVDTSTIAGDAAIEGSQGLAMMFDGVIDNSKACIVNVTSLWVSVKTNQPAAVNMYKIGSANDHDPRDPKDWVVYGSNDGENWVELDKRENQDLPDRDTLYTYTFENDVAYSYYKLAILSNNGKDAVGLDVVQLSEWQLFVASEG